MTRTKGKLSEWQSGTIAPITIGIYQRRVGADCLFALDDFGYWDGHFWRICDQTPPFIPPIYTSSGQVDNGVQWQWRGIAGGIPNEKS